MPDRPPSRRFFAILAGLACGGAIALAALWWLYRDPTPTLTPAAFAAAQEKWRVAGPRSYNIEVRVTGTQGAEYRVEVRGGEPRAAWRNGRPLTQRRTWGTWSVPGMFGTMERDVAALELHAAGRARPETPRVLLRAEFDPALGYPARYRRIEWGSPVEVAWEVTRFEPLAASDEGR